MGWRIEFLDEAKKDLSKLDKPIARRITAFLRERVAPLEDPRSLGQALRGTRLGELWKYRSGDFRIIARLEDDRLRVLVVKVGHRSEVYRS
ncbi:MAG: type II toxin-antitoxin system RelE/ParE family toxin [Chromatiaceae bacterium]